MKSDGQEQRTVDLRLLNGKRCAAVATGNNAAWLCSCGYNKPLIGNTLSRKPVVCVSCGGQYVVEPGGGNSVTEIVAQEAKG